MIDDTIRNEGEAVCTTCGHDSEDARGNAPLLGVGLAVLLALGAFFSGLYLGNGGVSQSNVAALLAGADTRPDDSVDLSQFWEVWHILEDKFVSSPDEQTSKQERVWGAIGGLVSSYEDPYTVFLPPEETQKFEQDIAGNFSGVGMEVGIRDQLLTVIAPLPDTPAEKAGIVAGDIIIKIDGTTTDRMNIDEAVQRIRGEKGTEVVLTIYRDGEEEFRDIAVVRDTISIPTSKTELRGDTFIITLYSFNAIAEAEMQFALREYVLSGAETLILDLRGDPGGYLQSAISIASYFLPVGTVVVRANFGPDEEEKLYRSNGKTLGRYAPKEMVVLVDEGSASASEILAGALQEHDVAVLMGAETFGKGSVQELVDLHDGSSVKITIARWLTPDGVSISDGGLTPDIVVERTPEDRIADHDPQLEAALEYLGR